MRAGLDAGRPPLLVRGRAARRGGLVLSACGRGAADHIDYAVDGP